MKFIPKDRKFNKIFKWRLNSTKKYMDYKSISLKFGNFGIKALEPGYLTLKHFTTLQLLIKRNLKKQGKFWFRKIPYSFLTKKPLEVRMGKGKGSHSDWICPVKIGQIILELKFKKLNFLKILKILRKIIKRLPFKIKVLFKGELRNFKISLNRYKFLILNYNKKL